MLFSINRAATTGQMYVKQKKRKRKKKRMRRGRRKRNETHKFHKQYTNWIISQNGKFNL